MNCLRRTFATFGIPDESATDGGPEFTAVITRQFLKDWGIHHRLSSVAFAHSNWRAEIGVKTVKRIISTNTDPQGNLNTDSLQRAILQYRNTPDPNTNYPRHNAYSNDLLKTPSLLHQVDTNQTPLGQHAPAREEALRNRHMRASERWTEHTRRLPPLKVGDHVRIQNQTGHNPTKLDKTGLVIEVRQFDQYVIKVDGSGRITIRNRKFLRQYLLVVMTPARHTIDDDLRSLPKTSTPNPSNTQTDSDINLPPPPAKLDTQGTPPPPDHDETTPPQIIPENTQPTPPQTHPTPLQPTNTQPPNSKTTTGVQKTRRL